MNSPPPTSSRRRSTSTVDINITNSNITTNEGESTAKNSESNSNTNKKQKTISGEQDSTNTMIDSKLINSLIKPSLYRLTAGLPRHELQLMENEAKECELALLEEIRILEEAIGISTPKETSLKPETPTKSAGATTTTDPLQIHHFTSIDAILTSELTPQDRFFSTSALLGRLRAPLYTPLPPNSSLLRGTHGAATKKTSSSSKKNASQQDKQQPKEKLSLEKQQALLTLDTNPIYRKKQDTTVLLALWKRISSHRSAAVFRKPVNSREVPLYAEKILFPIDLSLIRKMIIVGVITGFADLHNRIGLMCHNCVKFNGRESDYGIITREFEAYADDSIWNSVSNHDANPQDVPLV